MLEYSQISILVNLKIIPLKIRSFFKQLEKLHIIVLPASRGQTLFGLVFRDI